MTRKLHMILAMMGLFFFLLAPATTWADGGNGADSEALKEDWIGWSVAQRSTDDTDAAQPLPNGGTAYAEAFLGWAAARMDGVAKTSLSGDVMEMYGLYAIVDQVYRDGVQKGGSNPVDGDRTGGGSVEVTHSVYEWVFGSTWRNDTSHVVDGNGFFWTPQVTVTAVP